MVTKRRRTEIRCIMCGNAVKLPEYIGQDYNGDLLCNRCFSLLRIKLDKGEVKEFRVLEHDFKGWQASERLRELQEKLSELREKPDPKSNF